MGMALINIHFNVPVKSLWLGRVSRTEKKNNALYTTCFINVEGV